MSLRQKIANRFNDINEASSVLQNKVVFDKNAWQHEISTYDKAKDKNYRPAFILEMIDKYGWNKQQIIQAYADLNESILPIELSNESLANLLLQSNEDNLWSLEFISRAYVENNKKFNTKSLSVEAGIALVDQNWNQLKTILCSEISTMDNIIAESVTERYLLSEANKTIKKRFVMKKDKEGEVVEAEQVKAPEHNQLIDLLNLSNPVPAPYKNIGTSPASESTFLAPGRPSDYYPAIGDYTRRVSPETLRMQYM